MPQILLQLNLIPMISLFDIEKSFSHPQKHLEMVQSQFIAHSSSSQGFQRRSNDQIQVKNLAALDSFSVSNIILHFQNEQQNHYFSLINDESNDFFSEQPSYCTSSIIKGYLQNINLDLYQQKTKSINSSFQQKSEDFESEILTSKYPQISLRKNETLYLHQDNHEQEFQQKKIRGIIKESSFKQANFKSHSSKESTKNVTKNVGKLLFKFIWKNRHNLQDQMEVNHDKWQRFLTLVRQWKGENNITRQYLLKKWEGSSEENVLFRTISRYFFRKRCLSALYGSNICSKKVHLQKITKFDEAITNPIYLDSLN